MLTPRTVLSCFARTWLVGAAMTTRGMQHIGILFALNPGLTALFSDPRQLAEARQRYLAHANTHPFMAPLFIGLLLALERQVACGHIAPQSMAMLARTTATTLSALGDSFFSGTLLVFWALSTSLLVLSGMEGIATLWAIFLFALLLVFRVWTFFLGLRQGLAALQWVRQMDLINWGDRLKLLNALLLALLIWNMASRSTPVFWWENFLWGLLCLCCGSLLVSRVHMSRLLLAAIVVCTLHLTNAIPILP